MTQSLLVAHLVINSTEVDGKKKLLVDTGESGLCLQKGKIYTLQGPNGAGKSSLIRAVMGVPQARGRDPIALRLNEQKITIGDVADAIDHGLVAVFQDDQLIPTMTVREQLLLRHGGHGFSTLVLNSARKWVRRLPGTRSAELITALGLPMSAEEKVLDRANDLLGVFDAFHPDANYKGIMDKHPGKLSGGEHAVARLLLSQISSGVQVLFLDEIFRGVQREVWPRILDAIRKWAIDEKITVLAVSHSDEELIRWRPNGRFEMNHRMLRALPPISYDLLYPGLPAQNPICAVFDPTAHTNWGDEVNLRGPWVVFCDKAIEHSPAFQMVLSQLRGKVLLHKVLVTGEALKSLDTVTSLLAELSSCGNNFQSLRGASFLIAGGGSLINWAGFIASVLHRGVKTVLLPSTVMSIADVALGSKTSINLTGADGATALKHVLGTYHNPTAILLDSRLLKSLPIPERRFGLAECLKHGLLQDTNLWSSALELFRQAEPDWKMCFDVARRTMELKAHVLSLDPWERTFGRVLLYGHLHAHSLERISSLKIPHGLAVLFGLLMDMRLSGEVVLPYTQLYEVCRSVRIFDNAAVKIAISCTEADWRSAYFADPKDQHLQDDEICYLKIATVGAFSDPTTDFVESSVCRIAWSEFWPLLLAVLSDISMKSRDAQPGSRGDAAR